MDISEIGNFRLSFRSRTVRMLFASLAVLVLLILMLTWLPFSLVLSAVKGLAYGVLLLLDSAIQILQVNWEEK